MSVLTAFLLCSSGAHRNLRHCIDAGCRDRKVILRTYKLANIRYLKIEGSIVLKITKFIQHANFPKKYGEKRLILNFFLTLLN